MGNRTLGLGGFLILILFGIGAPVFAADPDGPCHYETWEWDVIRKRSVRHESVSKMKSDLSPEERGPIAGCSVCEEDQVEVRIETGPRFKVCRAWRDRVERALRQAVAQGFPLWNVVGYRVGRSKGPVSPEGARTRFSNHSYGTALDFNSGKNGLYDSCVRFGPSCRLVRGGAYRPGESGTVTPASSLYKFLTAEGLRWGGEIQGEQKDFMHFSPDGR